MKFSLIHYVQLGLGAVVAGCQYLAQAAPQTATYDHTVAGIAGAVLTVLGLMSVSVTSAPAAK